MTHNAVSKYNSVQILCTPGDADPQYSLLCGSLDKYDLNGTLQDHTLAAILRWKDTLCVISKYNIISKE